VARVVVAGGAGFVGSHVCDRLIDRGDSVVCIDNLVTGSTSNIEHLFGNENFTFVNHDATTHVWVPGEIDSVMHLASPHPQSESYWGNVNPIGPRSVYDEAKRYAEAMTMAYHRHHNVDVRIIRIFNTYGPRMRPDDGRVVSNFVTQALRGEPITMYGDGSQTRSFCYVDDQVAGHLALLDGDHTGPINIGNDHEFSVLELAQLVTKVTNSNSEIGFAPLPKDDPTRRRPDLTEARSKLGWKPVVELEEGIALTAEYFSKLL